MSTSTTAPTPVLVAVRPRRGYLVHLVVDDPKRRAAMRVGDMVFRSRALCRRRRMDFLIVGGHESPTATDEALAQTPYACEACARKAQS